MFTALDRYMARLIAVPLLATLVIAALLLMLDKMLRLFDFVATEGGPVSVVFKMLANLMPEYAGLGIPLGLMLGILLAFRKLATLSELDVMRAVGLSYTRLLRVPYLFAIALAVLNLAIVGYLQPLGALRLRAAALRAALGRARRLDQGRRVHQAGRRFAVRIEQSEDEGRQLMGIFVRDASKDGQVAVGLGRAGPVPRHGRSRHDHPAPDRRHDRPGMRRVATPRVLTFTSHDLPIDLPAIERFRARGDGDVRADPARAVRAGWRGQRAAGPRDKPQANFNFRLVEVVMMLLLPLLAVALAIPPKRSTSALGVFLSIVMVVTYHKVNEYGEVGRRARPGRSDPRAVGAVRAVRRADRLDVLAGRLCPRRPADRRARARVRQAGRQRVKRLFGAERRARRRWRRAERCRSTSSPRARWRSTWRRTVRGPRCFAVLADAGAGAADARPAERGGQDPGAMPAMARPSCGAMSRCACRS